MWPDAGPGARCQNGHVQDSRAARGTLGYAAPEALTGARSPAVDLFALGATLFEAFCGAPPFGRGLPAVERMLAAPAPAPSSLRPGLGEEWDRLFGRLLASDPAGRPRRARDLLRSGWRCARSSTGSPMAPAPRAR